MSEEVIFIFDTIEFICRIGIIIALFGMLIVLCLMLRELRK